MLQIRNNLEQLNKSIEQEHAVTRRNYATLNANIKRYMNNPGRPLGRSMRSGISDEQSNYLGSVSLSPNPRTIFDLWDELGNWDWRQEACQRFHSSGTR